MKIDTFYKQYVGGKGQLSLERPAVTIAVKLLEARERFGRLDVKIEPVAGSGTAWVSDERLTFEGKAG